jgi:hypothetical protein
MELIMNKNYRSKVYWHCDYCNRDKTDYFLWIIPKEKYQCKECRDRMSKR